MRRENITLPIEEEVLVVAARAAARHLVANPDFGPVVLRKESDRVDVASPAAKVMREEALNAVRAAYGGRIPSGVLSLNDMYDVLLYDPSRFGYQRRVDHLSVNEALVFLEPKRKTLRRARKIKQGAAD